MPSFEHAPSVTAATTKSAGHEQSRESDRRTHGTVRSRIGALGNGAASSPPQRSAGEDVPDRPARYFSTRFVAAQRTHPCESSTPAASASSPTPTADPRRSIVETALDGLAGVKHRGAVAADARTCDGTGLLTPHPAGIFGDRTTAWPCSSCGATIPAPGRGRSAGARRASSSSTGATPPVDDRVLGDLAARTRPEIVQAVFRDRERRHRRERRGLPAAAAHRAHAPTDVYVASCSFRTIVHKGLVAADALADFYLDLADERFDGTVRHLPPALLDQHAADLGAGPTVPHALPQRRDQHHRGQREPHARPGRSWHRGGRPRPRGRCSGPCSTTSDSDSGKLDEAVELLVRGGRHVGHADGHARARGVGGDPRPRPRGARASTSTTPRSWSRGTARPA